MADLLVHVQIGVFAGCESARAGLFRELVHSVNIIVRELQSENVPSGFFSQLSIPHLEEAGPQFRLA